MRTMIKVRVPVETGNRTVEDGTLPKTMMEALEKLKPEAAYFCPEHGVRTAFMVFDLKDASDMPVIAEPFFSRLHAEVEFLPVMNAEDLKRGLSKLRG